MIRQEHSQCEDLQSRLAAYALGEGAPEAAERRHLEECAECSRAYREYAALARVLPLTAPDAAPSPELRGRIVAAVEREAAAPAARPAQPAVRPVPAPQPRVRRQLGLWPALAASLAVIVALLGWNLSLQSQVASQAAQLANSREGWQKTIVLMNDRDIRWYPLAGDGSSGSLWIVPDSDIACLMAQGLPAIEDSQVYQVWLVDGDERTSGGVFEARNGNGWVILQGHEAFSGYGGVLVTVEPSGGSASPSGPLVMQGDIPHAE